MQKRNIWTAVGIALLFFGTVALLRFAPVSAEAVWKISNGGRLLFPLISVSALVDSVNPCAFSILLLTIAFLFTLGRTRRNIIAVGGAYIVGIFVVYLLIGLGILQTLHLFNTPHVMAKVGAALLIAFGAVELLNAFFPAFPIKLGIPHAAHERMAILMERASFVAAFGLGLFVGLCEFPCTGGPYLLVLGLLHDHETFWSGFGYLIWYNLIFVLPLGVILLVASNRALLERVREWRKEKGNAMRIWTGVIMLALGVAIFAM